MNYQNTNLYNYVHEQANLFKAFEVEFMDGDVLTCKTPIECEYGLRYLHNRLEKETLTGIKEVRIPVTGGTYNWRN